MKMHKGVWEKESYKEIGVELGVCVFLARILKTKIGLVYGAILISRIRALVVL